MAISDHLQELKDIRALQVSANAQGTPISRREAREILKEQKAAEQARTDKVQAAVQAARPEWLKDPRGLTGTTTPMPEGAIQVLPPPINRNDVPGSPLVIPRIYREDDSGTTLSECVLQVNANIYQGKIPISELEPYVP